MSCSGCRYSIIRPTGLLREVDPDDGKPYTLEFSQGDVVAGRLSRADVADVVTAALREPAATGATFEVRRTERWCVGGPATFDAAAAKVEFLKLVKGAYARTSSSGRVPGTAARGTGVLVSTAQGASEDVLGGRSMQCGGCVQTRRGAGRGCGQCRHGCHRPSRCQRSGGRRFLQIPA